MALPLICALLSWYDESPAFLAACLAGIVRHCDHLIAIDGAYPLYPGAQPYSPIDQAATILGTAQAGEIGCTLHIPGHTMSEVAKRQMCFRLADEICTRGDWLWIIDADEVITQAPDDLAQRLADEPNDVVRPTLYQRTNVEYEVMPAMVPPTFNDYPEVLLRWNRGFRVGPTHATYRDESVFLRGHDRELVESTIYHDIRVEHRTAQRSMWRKDAQHRYYQTRDAAKIEA